MLLFLLLLSGLNSFEAFRRSVSRHVAVIFCLEYARALYAFTVEVVKVARGFMAWKMDHAKGFSRCNLFRTDDRIR